MINEKYVNFETDYGTFELNLDYLMLKNKISNYKLCVLTGIRYEVIVRYRLNGGTFIEELLNNSLSYNQLKNSNFDIRI